MMATERLPVTAIITHLALGGAENVALSLAERLAGEFRMSFFIILAEGSDTDVGRGMAARLDDLAIPYAFGAARPFKRGGVIEAAWQLRRFIAAQRPRLLHVHTEIPELTLALATMLPGTVSVPVLRTVHNVELWGGWGPVGRWVERRLGMAAVAGVSNAALAADDALREAAKLPVLAHLRRRLIYNGVEPRHMVRPARPAGPQRVLFAGRFEYQKGADLLPAILARTAERTAVPFEVTLMGSGSLHNNLAHQIAKLPCPTRIMPAVSNLAQRLSEFDVVLMPSRFEGLPLLAIEALLAGVPVVATSAPGLAEVVPPYDSLSAPVDDVDAIADALIEYLDKPALYQQRVAARLPELQASFLVEGMADHYRDFYMNVMDIQ
jgi:glycosyltransferase involved in cell wall biosynthesis